METQRNLRTFSTRPIVLVVAVLSALAIGLTGWYALTVNASHRATGTPVTYAGGFPGPDARDRNEAQQQLHSTPNPEASHGH